MGYDRETDLCAAFKTWLNARSFVVYPEVGGWDQVAVLEPGVSTAHLHLLLDHTEKIGDLAPETQVGVHAKLSANIDVLYQAHTGSGRSGPNIKVVLVPRASTEFVAVAQGLGLAVVTAEYQRYTFGRRVWTTSPGGFAVSRAAKVFHPANRLWLPAIVADLPAGAQAPKQLTQWRVKALRLCRLAATRGYLTTADFKAEKVDTKRWVESGWLVGTGVKTGRLAHYVLGPTNPGTGWEETSAQLAVAETKEAVIAPEKVD